MIKFDIFSDGLVASELDLQGAYLFGQDEVPVRTQLEYTEGQLLGNRHGDTAIGLKTLWPVKDFGKVVLQTTRLPERDKAYNLNLEIVRGRLLKISQKREEWGLTDLALTEKHHELLDESLEQFINAICNIDEPRLAADFADQALIYAMQAGEQIALAHANGLLEKRLSNHGIGRYSFGCCFDLNRMTDVNYLKVIKEKFSFVTIPVSWRSLQPDEQSYDFAQLDQAVNWLNQNRIAIKIGPLVQFSHDCLPDWVYIWESDFEQVRELAYDFITKIVERYTSKVQAWDVVSSLNAENCLNFGFDQLIDMTRSACLAAKRAAAKALVLVEITDPWGSYYARNQRTIPPMIYLEMLTQSGVNFDGLGVKMSFAQPRIEGQMRDMLEFSALLDKLAFGGKPLHISGMGAPSKPEKIDGDDASDPGQWHKKWDKKLQAQWLETAYRIALSKSFVETVTWRDLADNNDSLLKNGGLYKVDMTPKLAMEAISKLKDKFTVVKK
ncbi:MAG: endo-1,4-beta-xylanase [Phycisphaerae bacterium]|nr:endo-1,4-beta-xylanase [Phycisphaerae bacterium]